MRCSTLTHSLTLARLPIRTYHRLQPFTVYHHLPLHRLTLLPLIMYDTEYEIANHDRIQMQNKIKELTAALDAMTTGRAEDNKTHLTTIHKRDVTIQANAAFVADSRRLVALKTQETAEAQDRLEKALAEIANLKMKISGLEEQIQKMQARLTELTQLTKRQLEHIQGLEAAKDAAERLMTELRARLEAYKRRSFDVDSMSSMVSKLKAALKAEKEKIAGLEAERDQAKAENGKLQTEVSRLLGLLAKTKSDLEALALEKEKNERDAARALARANEDAARVARNLARVNEQHAMDRRKSDQNEVAPVKVVEIEQKEMREESTQTTLSGEVVAKSAQVVHHHAHGSLNHLAEIKDEEVGDDSGLAEALHEAVADVEWHPNMAKMRFGEAMFADVSVPKKIPVTLKNLLGDIYDIMEKKLLADVADEVAENTRDSLPQFIEDYFVQKFGIVSLAMKKMGLFVGAIRKFSAESRRVKLFGELAGLSNCALYSRHISDSFFHIMRRIFARADLKKGEAKPVYDKTYVNSLKGVAEVLDDGEGERVILEKEALEAVVGHKGEGVKVSDDRTWKVSTVEALMNKLQVERFIQKIRSLPKISGKVLRINRKNDIDGIDLDHYMWMVVEELQEALTRHHEKLIMGYRKYHPEDRGRMSMAEFENLIQWCSPEKASEMSEKNKLQALFNLDERAGLGPAPDAAGEGEDESDDEEEDEEPKKKGKKGKKKVPIKTEVKDVDNPTVSQGPR